MRVLHMYEGRDKVLPSAQTQPGVQKVKSARCEERGGEGREKKRRGEQGNRKGCSEDGENREKEEDGAYQQMSIFEFKINQDNDPCLKIPHFKWTVKHQNISFLNFYHRFSMMSVN